MTALGRLYDDPDAVADRLLAIARTAHDARPGRAARRSTTRRLAEPDWFQRPRRSGYAAYADRFAGTLDGVAEHADHLAGLGVDLPPPDAAADPAAGAQRRRLRGGGLPLGATRPRRRGRPARPRDQPCAAMASASASTWCSTTPPASTRGRAAARAGDAEKRDYYLVLPRPADPRRSTSRRCRRCSPTSLRAASPGTTSSTAGSGRRSTTTSGTSTGRTRRCSASSPTSCSATPTSVSRCSGWTRSPSSGSGWAPPARTSPRCTT